MSPKVVIVVPLITATEFPEARRPFAFTPDVLMITFDASSCAPLSAASAYAMPVVVMLPPVYLSLDSPPATHAPIALPPLVLISTLLASTIPPARTRMPAAPAPVVVIAPPLATTDVPLSETRRP